MKPPLDRRKSSFSFSVAPEIPNCLFYEHLWDGPGAIPDHVSQPRQTTLLVLFDSKSRHLFSTARILVYYASSLPKHAQIVNIWVRQVNSCIVM